MAVLSVVLFRSSSGIKKNKPTFVALFAGLDVYCLSQEIKISAVPM